ncbi:MAG: DUF2298 domain-containing protein [Clostridiales bacterium]|jgi:YYY domain-containing protein|nr:DUF2298 domain-containing protein [Clostridiales bacterium]
MLWQPLQWWGTFFLLGLINLPLTLFLFKPFHGKGYIFSRIIGLFLSSFVLWFFSALHIVSFAKTFIWIVPLLLLAGNGLLVYFQKDYFSKINYKKFLTRAAVTEALFAAGFLFWVFVRGHKPDMEYNLEKFMDLGFIMSILRSDYMPAADMWYAGNAINYYYFGHFMCAVFIRMAGVAPEIGFNLWIATLYGFMLACTFSITSSLMERFAPAKPARGFIAGGVSAVMMAFGSNLHTFFEGFLGSVIRDKDYYEGYFYPNATRYVGYDDAHHFLPSLTDNDKCIHEFPFYSAIVADLHAHFIDILLVFTAVALIIAFAARVLENLDAYDWRKTPREAPLLALLLGGMYIANAWDFPVYGMLLGIVLWAVHIKKYGMCFKAFWTAVVDTAISAAAGFLLMFPFHINFKNIAGGIGSGIPRLAITLPDRFFILYGHFLFASILLMWLLYKLYRKQHERAEAEPPALVKRFGEFKETVSGIAGWIAPADMVAVCMAIAAIILILLPEFVYVRDIYEDGFPRANTMFKLTYQGYILFTLTMGYAVLRARAISKIIKIKKRYTLFLVLAVCLPLLYAIPKPFGGSAIDDHYHLANEYRGMDGLQYMAEAYPGDYQAVRWFNEHVEGSPVVLTANGNTYTEYGHINMATGLPTVANSRTHVWLWHGDVAAYDRRVADVAAVYQSPDAEGTKRLLNKYNVEYIVIGAMEREKFTASLNAEKLYGLGEIVFEAEGTQVIKVNR